MSGIISGATTTSVSPVSAEKREQVCLHLLTKLSSKFSSAHFSTNQVFVYISLTNSPFSSLPPSPNILDQFPNRSTESLQRCVRVIEAKAFQQATSLDTYVRKVSESLTDIQIHFEALHGTSSIYASQQRTAPLSTGPKCNVQLQGSPQSQQKNLLPQQKIDESKVVEQRENENTQEHPSPQQNAPVPHHQAYTQQEIPPISDSCALPPHQQKTMTFKIPRPTPPQHLVQKSPSQNAEEIKPPALQHQPQGRDSSAPNTLSQTPTTPVPDKTTQQVTHIVEASEKGKEQKHLVSKSDNECVSTSVSEIPKATAEDKQSVQAEKALQYVTAHVKEAVEAVDLLKDPRYLQSRRNDRVDNTIHLLLHQSHLHHVKNEDICGTNGQLSSVSHDDDLFASCELPSIPSDSPIKENADSPNRKKAPVYNTSNNRPLREIIEDTCSAAKLRNEKLILEIVEEFGLPVIHCMLRIPEMRLPKLVVMIQRGYQQKRCITYGFERPPMGWVGVLGLIRRQFQKRLEVEHEGSVEPAMLLEAWASSADVVMSG